MIPYRRELFHSIFRRARVESYWLRMRCVEYRGDGLDGYP